VATTAACSRAASAATSGSGFGERENDCVARHGGEVGTGQDAGRGQADEHVGAAQIGAGTRAGTIELAIPKLRQGPYYPEFLEHRRRAERALASVVATGYLLGAPGLRWWRECSGTPRCARRLTVVRCFACHLARSMPPARSPGGPDRGAVAPAAAIYLLTC
jgi:Transposase, Mutator family